MTNQLVLVAYGSKRGGTAEIAEWIGDALRDAGLTVDVRAARTVRKVADYHVVILGGALYAGRWHKDARRFVWRHTRALRDRTVWLFCSGPLDRSAEQEQEPAAVPGTGGMTRAAGRIGARGHIVFGGRPSPDAKGHGGHATRSPGPAMRRPERCLPEIRTKWSCGPGVQG